MRDLTKILAAAATLAAALPTTTAAAQSSQPACPANPAPPPAEFAGWTTPAARTVSTNDRVLPIAVGQAVRLTLAPGSEVAFARAPEKAPAAGSFAGLVALEVPKAGRYRVALGGPAWIDLVRDGAPLASAAHGHGPACTGIRKIVDFDLQPGHYFLQLSGSPAAEVVLMVAGPR
ncbi:hypothetical protein LZK98_16325 [Sphingomonas cannabina]|uniref:hypothetical protein n=1 Tax=Sphingomonas cannabina TaxID=2899123 RepID=UPI001F38D37C|nr:hypothetical protein [Sphingomonas cannabina]UIJ44610.1 hypothetical protein LZK98_16325 [Sphingomonas cannabina]